MIKFSLSDYLAQPGITQASLAEKVGLTQGAISHMVIRKRPVMVIVDGETTYLEEVKVRKTAKA